MPLFEIVTDLAAGSETLRQRRYGVIEVADGHFRRIVLRPFPKIVSVPGISLMGGWLHRHRRGDHLRLYYNQPRRFSNFLVLQYVESARDTSMGTLTRAHGDFGRDCPAEGERRPVVQRLELADHDEAARPLGLGAALPFAIPSSFHQAVLRQLSGAAGVVIGRYLPSPFGRGAGGEGGSGFNLSFFSRLVARSSP